MTPRAVALGIGVVALSGMLFAVGGRARAQSTPDDAVPSDVDDPVADPAADPAIEARALFEHGIELTRQERWGEALEYFRRSRELVDRPSTTFNMALALVRLGRPTDGLSTLDDYLRTSANDEREVDRREEARRLRDLVLASIAVLTLSLEPPSVWVRIDGALQDGEASPRELRIDPGTHRVDVGADGYETASFELSVLDGERAERHTQLSEIARPARLRVASNVSHSRILIDHVDVGSGEVLRELTPGVHRIEVRADGHEVFERTVELTRAERLDVRADLEPSESAWFESPWLWVVGSVLLVGAGVSVGVVVGASGSEAPYGGSTGVVLEGLRY